jgi:hypothetical protein
MSATIRLAPVASVSAHVEGGEIVAFNVGPDDNPHVKPAPPR